MIMWDSFRNSVIMMVNLTIVWLGLFILNSECMDLRLYSKVNSGFPSDFLDCFLESVPMGNQLNRRTYCANHCSRSANCHLFCLTENECQMYKARVSWYWAGVAESNASSRDCYSSWGSSNDAVLTATITAFPKHAFYGDKEAAVDGYMCTSDTYLYSSNYTMNPWWAADLGTIRKIYSVRVFTRVKSRFPSRFKNVEIRVGNYNLGNGDFSANALFGFYEGEANHSEVIYFRPKEPILGSVVSVQSLDTNYCLMIPDIQILYL